MAYTITIIKNMPSAGQTGGGGTYEQNQRVEAWTIPNVGYVFNGWFEDGVLITNEEDYIFRATRNRTLEANYSYQYSRSVEYDSTMGVATVSIADSENGNVLLLTAQPKDGYRFVRWMANSAFVSNLQEANYTLSTDTVFTAVFERIYDITDSVSGSGTLQISRGTNPNSITFNAVPGTNYYFEKMVVNGIEYTNNPLSYIATDDVTVTAYFLEDEKVSVYATTNIENGSVYISNNNDYPGFVSTIWARPFPAAEFIQWSDGVTTNPRSVTVNQNIYLIAEYKKISYDNTVYQYRCYVKEQLDLTAPPKAFMTVDTFDIKTDYLTNANSTITVYDIQSDINEGDVLVLYDPKGENLYQGVIKSISENKITCSQMQSFYKGQWVYHKSKQDFLEHEIAVLLQEYADGKIHPYSETRNKYVDERVAERLGGISINYVGSTVASLPTTHDPDREPPKVGEHGATVHYEVIDMEKWIYDLYETYGIVFEFQINFTGPNFVTIKTTNFEPIKISDNMYAIQEISPVTKVEETNRLIVYSAKDNSYRATWVATETDKYNATDKPIDRFKLTNTKIVFSDDKISDLVAANLPEQMYNHKVTFTLILSNFVYEFDQFHLGGELEIYYNNEYINSVLTGYRIKKGSNQNVSQVEFTCGKVRQKITSLLSMGKV